jgi:hypothetical protein
MFVGSHGMQIFGVSPQQKSSPVAMNYHQHRDRGSMTNLQFLGSLVDEANKKKQLDPKRNIKGILKNAISMPNLAPNSDHPKIDHRQLKNIIRRQKRTGFERSTRKTVKFNDPIGRLNQLESKYKLCSSASNEEETSLRKNKKIQQISLRNAQSENTNESSNVLVTVVYDLKLKENRLTTTNDGETKVKRNNNDNRKPEVTNETDNSDTCNQEQIHRQLPDEATAKDVLNNAHAQNGDVFLSHTVIAPVLPSVEKTKSIKNDVHIQSGTEEEIKHKTTPIKPRDSLVVTRSRAKPVMFTRCIHNSIPIADNPVHITTNFCDDEKTSHIMRWLNDVKYEQERDGFCTLLISDGENKY